MAQITNLLTILQSFLASVWGALSAFVASILNVVIIPPTQ